MRRRASFRPSPSVAPFRFHFIRGIRRVRTHRAPAALARPRRASRTSRAAARARRAPRSRTARDTAASRRRVRMHPSIHRRDDNGKSLMGARGSEDFGITAFLRPVVEYAVCQLEDFRGTAVVCLDFEYFSVGVFFGKTHDLIKIGSAPGVDALSVVTHCHNLMMNPDFVHDLSL